MDIFKTDGFNTIIKEVQKRDKAKQDTLYRETGKVISLSINQVQEASLQGITQEALIKIEYLQKHKLELTDKQYRGLEYVQSQSQGAYVITLPSNYLETNMEKSKGFSIIEFLITVSLLGLVASFVFNSAGNGVIQFDLKTKIKQAVRLVEEVKAEALEAAAEIKAERLERNKKSKRKSMVVPVNTDVL